MIKKNDIILFAILILIAIAAIFFLNLNRTEGGRVVITVNGKEYKTLDLDKDATITIEDENGDYNTVVIKDGIVDMTGANCPDKLCVKHKSIHYNGETIVCLPHKVVLEIVGGEEDDVDITAK
jgi:hypothetical protein